MKEIVEKILKESINAPSGSNSQPWEFICSENTIKIKYLPYKDHPVLNFNNRGTLIACGALLENIIITSKHYGLNVQIEIPSGFPNDIVANLKLEKTNQQLEDDLYSYLNSRTTNRKSQHPQPLDNSQTDYLLQEAKNYKNIQIVVVTDKDKIKNIALNLAYDTYLNFNNDTLRNLLFKELLFDQKLAQEGKEGLYVKTMEFKPPQVFFLKLLKNEKIFNFFKKRGFIKSIYKNVTKAYSLTGTFLGFSVLDKQEEFLNLGRVIENIWLRATKLNLSCHLITGLPFFWQKLNFDKEKIFSEEEVEIINKSYKSLKELFQTKNNLLFTATMRIGKSSPPSAISIKKPPIITWEG